MSNHSQAIAIIKSLTGQANILTIPRIFVDFMESLDGALFLSQVIYWSDRASSEWFYKTYNEWQDEIYLSKYEVSKQSKKLQKMGLLETKIKKANGAPTVHYKFSFDDFEKSFVEFLDNRKLTNSTNESEETNHSLTETTSETTTENNPPSKKFGQDPLTDMVNGQEQVDETTAPNPTDQWLEYSNQFIQTFHKKTGRYPNEDEKTLISSLASEPDANPQRWEKSLTECNLHYGGHMLKAPRVIEVYHAGGSYEAFKQIKWGDDSQQQAELPPEVEAPNIPTIDELTEGESIFS